MRVWTLRSDADGAGLAAPGLFWKVDLYACSSVELFLVPAAPPSL